MTEETWQALLEGYRQKPGVFAAAAKFAGCDRRTATKAWKTGLPTWHEKRPIEELLRGEQVAARARMREEEEVRRRAAEAEKDKAQEQAIQARKTEGQVVAVARANSLTSQAVVAEMLRNCRELAKRVGTKLKELLQEDEDAGAGIRSACVTCGHVPKLYTPGALISLLDKVTSVGRRVNDISAEAMRMERLHLGLPEEIIGLVDNGQPIDMLEAQKRLRVAQQAVGRSLQAAGLSADADPNELH